MSRLLFMAFTFLLTALPMAPVWAQYGRSVKEKVEEFTSESGTPVKLGYLEVGNTQDFSFLSRRMPADQYPMVIVEKPAFGKKIGLIRKLQVEALQYASLTDEFARQDSLDELKDAVFQEIVAAEKQRADRLKETNTQLNAEITRLSEQIDRTVGVGQKSLRGRNFKNLMIGALGAGIGFASGLVLGVVGGF